MPYLDSILAQELIDKISKNLEYNINVMDEKGIIIASGDISRIGKFHEVAYKILCEDKDIEVVYEGDKYLGAKPGVNMIIRYKNNKIGVLGVSGNPEEVLSFALVVKMSMETMLEYELYKEGVWQRQNRKDLFLHMILYGEESEVREVNKLAKKLEYSTDIIRIPILIKFPLEYDSKTVLTQIKTNPLHSKQDISTIARNNFIIVFKSLGNNLETVIKTYKEEVSEYLNSFVSSSGYNIEDFTFYVGTMQKEFNYYRESYRHALWLSKYIKDKNGLFYFNEYIFDYFKSIIPLKVYNDIFNVFDNIITKEEKRLVVETIEALSKNNYSILNSSKSLYIHRNTMLFRLNKIKEMFNIDPINDSNDRVFLNNLVHYYKEC